VSSSRSTASCPARNNVIRPILSCANALYRLPMPRRRALDRFVRNRIDRRLTDDSRAPVRAEAQFHRRAVSEPAEASRSALSSLAYTGPRRRGLMTHGNAPPLRSAGRISSGAARWYHLVAVTPLEPRCHAHRRPAVIRGDAKRRPCHRRRLEPEPSAPPAPLLGDGVILSGHDDGVVPHVRGIGHSARLRQVRLPFPDDTRPDTTVIDTCSTCDATTATRH